VRSQRPNEPALIRHTANCLAQVRGLSLEEFAALTTANARAFYRIA
jgi:TatD DNase family protein